MRFLLYTKISEDTVSGSLGLPEYSYYFVYREFQRIFSRFGETVSVNSEQELLSQFAKADNDSIDCIAVLFCPPHVAPDIEPYKGFCVLAWEFDTIPYEVWDDEPRNDWRFVLNKHPGVVCLSSHTKKVIKKAMGASYPVSDIAVPVWDRFSLIHDRSLTSNVAGSLQLDIDGNVIDNRAYVITPERFELKPGIKNFKLTPWDGTTLSYVFNLDHTDSAMLGGFYHAEPWGTWSRMETPWLFLETEISGDFSVGFRARGFGRSVGKEIVVEIGGVKQVFLLSDQVNNYQLQFRDVPKSHVIRFSGLDLTPPDYPYDGRSMAIGLESLSVKSDVPGLPKAPEHSKQLVNLEVNGFIYTTVLNPADPRKNWEDIVRAFCYVFSDNADVTLILKITHQNLSYIMGRLHFLLQQIGKVECRVIAIHGFLPEDNFSKLIENSSFYVNASSAEGLCLPLLEFMASGVPAIAPTHTAMADYIDQRSSFVVETSKEQATWPHDPRLLKRATSNRINWDSLVAQLSLSFDCLLNQPEAYLSKSIASRENVKNYSSSAVVSEKLEKFLEEIT